MILDGQALAIKRLESLAKRVKSSDKSPHIHFVRIGDDPASEIYVNLKANRAQSVGIESTTTVLPSDTTQKDAISVINQLNNDPNVNAILIQLPLPNHIDTDGLINAIDPQKDVDGLTDINVGRLSRGKPLFTPCTPKGIVTLLNHYQIPISGQNIAIIGRSRIVGKPLSYCLTNLHATVTLCHQKTVGLSDIIGNSNMVISATGNRQTIQPNWLQENTVVVDVGIHRTSTGICGDLDLESVKQTLKAYTPVPRGVGPMTVCSLLENTAQAAQI